MILRRLLQRRSRAQATTEVVLLMPLFMLFLFLFAKIFALLVLVQKMEIASYYAARRWQLESHRNVAYEGFDGGQGCGGALCQDILKNVNSYLGYGTAAASYLDLDSCSGGAGACLTIQRTQVWNIVTLTVRTKPLTGPIFKYLGTENKKGFEFTVTKYVPNRDRPIAFQLPGIQN